MTDPPHLPQRHAPTPSLPVTSKLIEQGIAAGLHIGAQLYLSLHGRPVADLAFGQSRPGVPMTPNSLMLWMSGTKPVGAVAIAQLWEKGKLTLDDRIARHIPEFAIHGKELVTIRHVLTHTAGFRWVETGWPEASWEQTIARICDARQERDWVAGRNAGYSPYASWFLLGEIVRRLDGRDFGDYVLQEIFRPLGMTNSWLALPPDRYRAYGERIGVMQKTDKGQPSDAGLDTEPAAAACRPSGGGRGPARELGRFYEMLLAGGAIGAARILSPQTVEALVARHRVGIKDRTFNNHLLDWGLGFLVNSAHYYAQTSSYPPYNFGPRASARTFGHGGSQSSTSFADPEYGLAAVVICNGMPGETAHQQRMREIHTAIYEDLELT